MTANMRDSKVKAAKNTVTSRSDENWDDEPSQTIQTVFKNNRLPHTNNNNNKRKSSSYQHSKTY